ncbi:MarR family transcriptional regulator [Gallaecimonas kandeliae]|uniref:MarR family transcriptional regulator n=1 Tax=Gallaecimonas kandeliae TaxID=3029055 RepID=UPI00264989CC|nr:MarR family transcriptional regulator [Gallaecimonas kandeliae]WKE64707.1 MarR family transcriptional regulator [Gallaecimonas kandeliae]
MESNLGWLMNRAGLSWRHVVDKYMAKLGLTQTRWVALLVLDRIGEGCTQSALAANVGVEQPSMVRTLSQLEEAGLIERRASESDARCRTLWFSPEGRKLIKEMEAVAKEGRELLLQGISPERRQVLHDVLEQVISNAQALLSEESK